ncbi:aldo/keto reductase [Maritimibacter sp. DP1N21-5]|uniref:aldo/keto reductase n=1 Tax=Maritimibacter sp. DP1N21-5 TaxID=2836867 RepID=UPI001C47D556|nr:aldo/keto reductase [Maritimibacter sp. DP1N21-5]MBV7409336.1 aldo/keto reductase [Maritimibacter sp. DP1N21-5]
MKMNQLAGGTLVVSELCLGSMTWGRRNTEAEGHAQIDHAFSHGVTFVDTAEMYPVNPVARETVGRTEEIIGTWNAANKARRADYVLATKVTGPSGNVRAEGYDGTIIRQTIEDSLRRLQTDYVDLYQLHFPDRGSYHFRQIWGYDPSNQSKAKTETHMLDVLETMSDLVAAGKVRHFGLSNETAWGTATWLRLAREMGAPEVVSIQNEYSLLCRSFDGDLAELSANEDVKLLAYSPLATGLLTGKYEGGSTIPENSRMAVNETMGGRVNPRMWAATEAYLDIARRHDLDPVVLALAFASSRPFMGSVIFGASEMDQLDRALAAQDVVLSEEVQAEINSVHRAHPMPF